MIFQDAKNTSVLNNEVIAIDMGTEISNLTTDINITYRSVKKVSYKTRTEPFSVSIYLMLNYQTGLICL